VRTRPRPLLVELHAHTTWSDGQLSVRELIDLHGLRGFDVLCVTDHVVRTDDPWRDTWGGDSQAVPPERFGDYLAEVEREAERALLRFGMLVVPGAELTYNDLDPARAAHAVAVGLRSFVSVDQGIDGALETARAAGAAIIAAHPYRPPGGHPLPPTPNSTPEAPAAPGDNRFAAAPRPRSEALPASGRGTERWAHDEALRTLAHRFELFNRSTLFGWVAEAGLPVVACGDVHVAAHVEGWKTLLPCDHDEEALVAYLRSGRPTYLARLDATPALAA
jgi:hypothetical protein